MNGKSEQLKKTLNKTAPTHALTRHRLLFLDSAECPVQGADSHACSSCSASKVAAGTQPFTLKTNFSRAAAARIARISPRKGRLASPRLVRLTKLQREAFSLPRPIGFPFNPRGCDCCRGGSVMMRLCQNWKSYFHFKRIRRKTEGFSGFKICDSCHRLHQNVLHFP